MVEYKAYGKVNLGLDIIGRRDDGYHMVKMIMQSVDIYDTLTFEKIEEVSGDSKNQCDAAGKPEIKIIATNDPDLSLGEDNLIYKACRILMDKYCIKDSVLIKLTKNIPIAAGMAGGSSDCAAALKGMNKLFDLHLTEEELREIGVTLGADVPYCIAGGTMISEGIGEVLTELPDIPDLTFLIAKPVFGISTKEAYGDFDAIPEEDIVHPDIDGMAEAIRNSDICGIVDRLGNVLEDASIPKHQEIEEIKNIMKKNGALNALMSGSGPTVFGIFTDETVDEGTGNGETLSGKEKAWRTVQILQEKEYISDLFTVGAVKKSDIDK